ncbi:MAG: HEPN domain-containing protein, partial [Candidatus Aminicenantales bacterium]
MDKQVKNWLDSARYDLETAEHMLNAGRYIHTIFMCQLSLEKALKAKVQEITGKIPPKTHNLRYLIKLSRLDPPEEIFDLLSKLSG